MDLFQCGSNTKEIHHLREQLSAFVQSQLDFQQRIETQLATLQTMMQTICQVVNNDMLSNRRPQTDLYASQSNQNWLTNAQRPYLVEKDTDNAMNELLTFTRRINNGEISTSDFLFSILNLSASPIDAHRQHSDHLETSKKLMRPTSAISTTDGKDTTSIRRSSMISPLDASSASPVLFSYLVLDLNENHFFRLKQYWKRFCKNVFVSFNRWMNWINNMKWLRENWRISKGKLYQHHRHVATMSVAFTFAFPMFSSIMFLWKLILVLLQLDCNKKQNLFVLLYLLRCESFQR